jgi:hypothetical protein
MKNQNQLLQELAGCHVLIYAGDGTGRPKELLFSSGTAEESDAIRDAALAILAKRRGDGRETKTGDD